MCYWQHLSNYSLCQTAHSEGKPNLGYSSNHHISNFSIEPVEVIKYIKAFNICKSSSSA